SEQQNGADGPDNNASGGGDGADNNASGNGSGTDAGDGDQPSASGNSEQSLRSQGLGAGSAIADAYARRAGANLELVARESRDMEEASWRRVAKALEVNLQTMSKARGAGLGDLLGDLENVTQTRVDYRDFLRQFAIPGEVLRLSDDEYDYIFYTYGLKLYGNLPLIEPLEYREEKRIREFVIVIDTSGSVWGDIVRRFMETTFEILKSTESFFEKVNIRIIQCDARVQSDDKITTLEELRQWGSRMRLMGGGGTDFRPAFAYVDKLIEDGEFENLGGLVYFTDGWGEYPTHMPDYKTAFVFYDNDYRPENVPPWAIQAVLNDEEIYRMSR
ncbi:MAG: hypothetical protein IKD70_08090, partial [Eggerthellaceae bacterium]|nr:hypothetical protein [Eggerthellaceae bacterium]